MADPATPLPIALRLFCRFAFPRHASAPVLALHHNGHARPTKTDAEYFIDLGGR